MRILSNGLRLVAKHSPANSDQFSDRVDDDIPPSIVHQTQATSHDAGNKGFKNRMQL